MTGARDGCRLTVLGSGTILPSNTRSSAAFYVEAGPVHLLLDCGPGTLHGFARHDVDWRALTHIAVTHEHLDHLGDLSSVLFALKLAVGGSRTAALTLIGPPGFTGLVDAMCIALGDHLSRPGFDVGVVELDPNDALSLDGGRMVLRSVSTPHTEASVGYRLSGEGFSVGYTGDTGPSHDVASFMAGCDVLVAECAGGDDDGIVGHLSPDALGAMARVARPGLLVVTHVYPPNQPSEVVGRLRRLWSGKAMAGEDGSVVQIASGRSTVVRGGVPA